MIKALVVLAFFAGVVLYAEAFLFATGPLVAYLS